MLRLAYIELVVCWVAWFLPFVLHGPAGLKRKAAVTNRRSLWGLGLEAAGLFVAWFRTREGPGMERMVVSMALAPLGTALAWWAVAHLGKQLRIQAGLYDDHELVRSGPYGWVRHPIYLALFVMLLATTLLNGGWVKVAVSVVLFLAGTEIRVRMEDRLLASRFGTPFEEYRRRVPAYLPGVR